MDNESQNKGFESVTGSFRFSRQKLAVTALPLLYYSVCIF